MSLPMEVLNAFLYFLPAYMANMAPCYMAHFSFFKALAYPLDMGWEWMDGRRMLGDGKTLAGIVYGAIIGAAVSLGQGETWLLGFVMAIGALMGDLVGSFLKRRIDVGRGERTLLLDQLDFVVGAMVVLYLVGWAPPLRTMVILLLITPPLHLLMNYVGYAFKYKEVPW